MTQPPEVLLSRSGSSSPLGTKLDAELPKLRISYETFAGLQRLATQCDMNLSEYIRTHWDCHVHGVDHVATLAAERVRRAVGMGRDCTPRG